jgi:ketosteroid isomerase-like protein
MDDRYAIRLAKTKLREAFCDGDVNAAMAIFGERFTDMSDGLASFYGGEAPLVLRHRLTKMFECSRAELAVTIIAIRVLGSTAFDWGWHQLTLAPKNGGKSVTKRSRYLEIWQKDAKGRWRISIYLDNPDVAPEMPPDEVLNAMRLAKGNPKILRAPKPAKRLVGRSRPGIGGKRLVK